MIRCARLIFIVMMLTVASSFTSNPTMFRRIFQLRSPMARLGLLKNSFAGGMSANFGRVNVIQSPTNGVKVIVKGLKTTPDNKSDLR